MFKYSTHSFSFCCFKIFPYQYCGGVDWRTKLDTQRGAVLAAEIKNNAFKLARWTVCSMLAGADQLKLGFVSRVNPRDSSRHVILGTQQFKPSEFASQLNLNMDNGWGILRCVIDFFMKMPEGKYLMLKDPNKPVIRIYSIPQDPDEGEGISEEEEPNNTEQYPSNQSKAGEDGREEEEGAVKENVDASQKKRESDQQSKTTDQEES
ncbi:unnamed protein product [Trichobilharzia regenti]|nr:unnamed protein product [Trichobilharzia regenti]